MLFSRNFLAFSWRGLCLSSISCSFDFWEHKGAKTCVKISFIQSTQRRKPFCEEQRKVPNFGWSQCITVKARSSSLKRINFVPKAVFPGLDPYRNDDKGGKAKQWRVQQLSDEKMVLSSSATSQITITVTMMKGHQSLFRFSKDTGEIVPFYFAAFEKSPKYKKALWTIVLEQTVVQVWQDLCCTPSPWMPSPCQPSTKWGRIQTPPGICHFSLTCHPPLIFHSLPRSTWRWRQRSTLAFRTTKDLYISAQVKHLSGWESSFLFVSAEWLKSNLIM